MQLAPKPSTDNLDLYIQIMEQQNQRQKRRLLKIGLIGGLFVAVLAAGVFMFMNNPFAAKETKQLTYLMFHSDYLPHQEIISFLNSESHGVIIRNEEEAISDTLLDVTSYERWLRMQNQSVEFSVNQLAASADDKDDNNEPEINTSPLGLIIRGNLEADRPLTFSISGYRPDFNYYLDFGNGRSGKVNSRYTYRYSESGSFVVKLTAKDEEGNERTVRRRITIRLPRPEDEVIADKDEDKAETLVITDLGDSNEEGEEDVATSTTSDVSPMEDLGFDEFDINDTEDAEGLTAKGSTNPAGEDESASGEQAARTAEPKVTNLDLSNHVFMATEVPPSFPGGSKALRKFLGKSLNYPNEAMQNGIEGKVVVQFVVKADGSIESPKIIQGLGYGCDAEVLEIMGEMPRWSPGLMAGKPVNSSYSLPVVFKLR